MAHITIRNIGPIKEVDIELNKINVFMGPQSSGKSTIAKIICHCQWVEKQCFPAFENGKDLVKIKADFYDKMVEFHRLDGYFSINSSFSFVGDYYTINYYHKDKKVSIKENANTTYSYPKIVYIPSERNIVATIPNLKKYNETNDAILYFMYEWFSVREILKQMSLKKILQKDIIYSYFYDKDYIVDNDNKILVSNASSGIQSLTPLAIVLKHNLENIFKTEKPLSFGQRMLVYSVLDTMNGFKELGFEKKTEYLNYMLDILKKFSIPIPNNTQQIISHDEEYAAFVENVFNYHLSKIFLEEPEQNLFPDTQIKLVYWLLELFKNGGRDNQLTITTHSPYILFSLNNCMMGGLVENKIPKTKRKKLDSSTAWIDPKSVSIYEIVDGRLRSIQDKDGIIEDNYLNQAYKTNAAEYISLLDYYDNEE